MLDTVWNQIIIYYVGKSWVHAPDCVSSWKESPFLHNELCGILYALIERLRVAVLIDTTICSGERARFSSSEFLQRCGRARTRHLKRSHLFHIGSLRFRSAPLPPPFGWLWALNVTLADCKLIMSNFHWFMDQHKSIYYNLTISVPGQIPSRNS